MRPIVTDGVAWSVCRSVGLCAAIVSDAKAAEAIEMSVVFWTRVGPRNHVLDADPDPPCEGDHFKEGKWPT